MSDCTIYFLDRVVKLKDGQSINVGRASARGTADRRERKDNLLFANKTVSRKHAKILNAAHALYVSDQGSNNGTRLVDPDGGRIDVGSIEELVYSGDTLLIGDHIPSTATDTQYKPVLGTIRVVFSPKPATKLGVNSFGLLPEEVKSTSQAKGVKDEQECVYLGTSPNSLGDTDVISVPSSGQDSDFDDESDVCDFCGNFDCPSRYGEGKCYDLTDEEDVDLDLMDQNPGHLSDADSKTASITRGDDAQGLPPQPAIDSLGASPSQVTIKPSGASPSQVTIKPSGAKPSQVTSAPVSDAIVAPATVDDQVTAIATTSKSPPGSAGAASRQCTDLAVGGESLPAVSDISKTAAIAPPASKLTTEAAKLTIQAALPCDDLINRLLAARGELDDGSKPASTVTTPNRPTEKQDTVPRREVQPSSDSVVATSGSDIAEFPLIADDKTSKIPHLSDNEPAVAAGCDKDLATTKQAEGTAAPVDATHKDTSLAIDAADSGQTSSRPLRWSVSCATLLLAPDIEKSMDKFLLMAKDADADALDANARAFIDSVERDDDDTDDEDEDEDATALSQELASECQNLRKEACMAFEAEMMAKIMHEREVAQAPTELQTQAQLFLAAYKADSSVADFCMRSSIFPSPTNQDANILISRDPGQQTNDVTKILTGLRTELDLQAHLIRELTTLQKRKHSDVAVNTDEETSPAKRAKNSSTNVPPHPDTAMIDAPGRHDVPSNVGKASHFDNTHKRNASSWRQSMVRVLGGAVLGSAVTIGGLLAYGQ